MKLILEELMKNITSKQYTILYHLLENGGKIRKELVKELNIPRSTIFDNLKKLRKKKLVFKIEIPMGEIGRPKILWQAKQAHNLVLFNQPDKLISPKQKKSIKNEEKIEEKIPDWVKKTLKNEVRFLTYTLKVLETKLDSNPIEIKKFLDDKPSYIVPNMNSELTKYTINKINDCTYFRTATLAKYYVDMILKIKHPPLKDEIRRSTSNRIGRITAELLRLGLIINHSNTARNVWKNLHKGDLHNALNKKIEEKYFTIKLKDDTKT